jgi:predicted double-glycine peptidase
MVNKRGGSQLVLKYFTDNADRPITLNELVENVGLDRQQSTSAANLLVGKYTEMIRRGSGTYEWSTKEPKKDKTEMLVTIIMRKDDGTMLVKDTEDDVVYVIRPLEF